MLVLRIALALPKGRCAMPLCVCLAPSLHHLTHKPSPQLSVLIMYGVIHQVVDNGAILVFFGQVHRFPAPLHVEKGDSRRV